MPKYKTILTHWLLFALCTTLLTDQSHATEQDEGEPPWFEVEVIIFTRAFNQANQDEDWPEFPGTPDWPNARPLQPDLIPSVQPDAPELNIEGIEKETVEEEIKEETDLPVPYALIPEEEYRLTKEAQRLRRTGGRLNPVVHLAWRQPVIEREQAELLYVRAPAPTLTPSTDTSMTAEPSSTEPPKLEGTLRLSVSRYLHVDIDLLRREPAIPTYPYLETRPTNEFAIFGSQYNSYRMQDHRRMRSGELHYIDHPLMGVLIQITPYELPKPIDKEEEEEESQQRLIVEGESQPAPTDTTPSETTEETPTDQSGTNSPQEEAESQKP